MATPTIGALILGGLIGGTTFAVGASVVQEVKVLGKNVFHKIEDEFAQHRKQKEISPLQVNDDISDKLTKSERTLLTELTKS